MNKKVYRGEWAGCSNFQERKNELQEAHEHFKQMLISGEIKIDVPVITKSKRPRITTEKFKTIKIFGKDMVLTIEEYRTHYLKAELK